MYRKNYHILIMALFFLVQVGCTKKKEENPSTPDSSLAYRVIVAPNSNLGGNSIFPSGSDWTLSFQFKVPPIPSTPTWNTTQVFYVWGDVSFDEYGSLGDHPLSSYKFNQIVPQVMIGNSLDGNDSNYAPTWSQYSTWVIQAQYFWMHQDGTVYAQTGSLIDVNPGESLTTTIAYTSSSGAIVASISGPGGTSSITIPKPFPNEATSLFSSWKDFFQQAEAQTTSAYGLGVVNIETYDVDQDTLCSVLPFEIQAMSGPGFPSTGSAFHQTQKGSFSCPTSLVDMQF